MYQTPPPRLDLAARVEGHHVRLGPAGPPVPPLGGAAEAVGVGLEPGDAPEEGLGRTQQVRSEGDALPCVAGGAHDTLQGAQHRPAAPRPHVLPHQLSETLALLRTQTRHHTPSPPRHPINTRPEGPELRVRQFNAVPLTQRHPSRRNKPKTRAPTLPVLRVSQTRRVRQ
jgi:hypothetical protein